LHRVHLGSSGLFSSPAKRSVFGTGQTALNLLVNLTNHKFKLIFELVFIETLVACGIWVFQKVLLQEIIMALFARSNVCFSVGEEIVGAERQEVKFADVFIIEVVTPGQTNEKGLIAVLAHQLVKLLLYMVHL